MLDIFKVKYSDHNLRGGDNNFICENIKNGKIMVLKTISIFGP